MPASLSHLGRKQARHTLLGDAIHAVIIENPHVPSKLHRVFSETERKGDARDPHVIFSDQLDQDAGDEGVGAIVRIWQRIILASIAA